MKLEHHMEANDYAMNRDKAVTLLGFCGPGTHTSTKKVMKRATKVYGEPRTDPYQGPQVSLSPRDC